MAKPQLPLIPPRPQFSCAALILCLLLAPRSGAREEITVVTGVPATGTAYHVVRPGETLEFLAAFYLGSHERWREIWGLNSEIPNPHLIRPGQRLKVPVVSVLPPSTARLAKTARRVEDELRPHPWDAAWENDLLKPRDGVRTFEGASAELVFSDATHLVLTEESLVILGQEEVRPRVQERQHIEVVLGQADLESRPVPGSPAIEIVLGEALSTPRPEAGGDRLRTRNRRPQSGGAQVMVYEGESEVAAAGAEVKVGRGMGTSVPSGQPPSPPEQLLSAPMVVAPRSGARHPAAAVAFRWQPVAGARAYVLEVCGDPACGRLVERVTGLEAPGWEAGRLAEGEYFWRVTGVSASGLDGYPSAPVPLAIVPGLPVTLPGAAVRFLGPQVGVDERLVVGPGIRLQLDAEDQSRAVTEWIPLIDGQETTFDDWSGPWPAGAHTAGVIAVDRTGKRTLLAPVAFTYDPEPPVLIWGVEDGAELGRHRGGAEEFAAAGADAGDRKRARRKLPQLVWTSSKMRWLRMAEEREWVIRSDRPYIVVRGRKKAVAVPAIGHTMTADRGLWIHAVDDGCGVAAMSYQLTTEPGEKGQPVLVVTAIDALDNVTRVVWPLARR